MTSKTLVSVEECLSMPYEGREPEYWDGEVIERSMPNLPHSGAFDILYSDLRSLCVRNGWLVRAELRMKLQPSRYLVPDLCVYRSRPASDPPSVPPVIVIDILSPDDRMAEVLTKLGRYQEWGVEHVWLANPIDRTLPVFDETGFHQVPEFVIEDLRLTPERVFGA